MLFLSCLYYAFVRVCLLIPCGHLLGKGLPSGSHLWCLIVKLSLSDWYPGPGVGLIVSIPNLCLFLTLFRIYNIWFSCWIWNIPDPRRPVSQCFAGCKNRCSLGLAFGITSLGWIQSSFFLVLLLQIAVTLSIISSEPVHEIYNNLVCATSKTSDQPAHTRSLIKAFASRLNILWVLSYWLNTIWSFQA